MPPKKRFITCEICGYRTSRENREKRLFMAKFPLDEDRCRQWVKFVGKQDLINVPIEKLHTLKYVCVNHFEDKAFNEKRNRLNKSAIPSKNLKSDPLPDGMLLEFPSHVYSNVYIATSHDPVTCDNKVSLSQVEAIAGTRIPLHRFPNPFNLGKPEAIERFRTWVMKIGGDIVGEADAFIFDNRRVCHRHFEGVFIFPTKRLSKLAIPTLHVPGKSFTLVPKEKKTDQTQAAPAITIDLPLTELSLKRKQDEPAPGTVDEGTSPPSHVPPETPAVEDTGGNDEVGGDDDEVTGAEAVFSWQTSELIEADETEEKPLPSPPPPPPPPADKHALFRDLEPEPEPETEAQPEDQAVPEPTVPDDKDHWCGGCRKIIERFEFWCVQCACGVMCGACALRPPHHSHYVLRAPATATRIKTQAVLAVLRRELLILTQNDSEDICLEVKDEPTVEPTDEPDDEPTVEPTDEPDDEPTVEPTDDTEDEPIAEPTEEPCLVYQVSGEGAERDPLACDLDEPNTQGVYECSEEEIDRDQPLAKRRRLSDHSSAKENFLIEQHTGSQDLQHTELRGSQIVQNSQRESQVVPDRPHRDSQVEQFSQLKGSRVVQLSQLSGSQAVKPRQTRGYRLIQEKVPHKQLIKSQVTQQSQRKESQTMQQTQLKGSEILEKTVHIPNPQHSGKTTKPPSIEFSHLNKAQIALLSQLEGFKVVQDIPTKGSQLPQHSQIRGSQEAQHSQLKGPQLPQHSQHRVSQVEQHSQIKEPLLAQQRPKLVTQLGQIRQRKGSQLPQTSRLRGSQAPVKVTSEGSPQTLLIDSDDVTEEETVEYLDESLLESDPETVLLGSDTQIELQENDGETVIGSGTVTVLSERDRKNLLHGNRETLQESDAESIDDDVLDKDYRVEELDDSDESRTNLDLESLIAKRLAAMKASRKNKKEKSPPARDHEKLPEVYEHLSEKENDFHNGTQVAAPYPIRNEEMDD